MSKDERHKLMEGREPGRARRGLTVEEAEKLMGTALNRVRLALSEVKVKEQWKDRKLVTQTVVNHDAVVRARQKYVEAAQAIGVVRELLDLTHGPQRPNPVKVTEAEETLDYYRRELERLQGLS